MLLLATFLILHSSFFVSESQAQVKFGLQAGVNMSSVSLKDVSGSVKNRTGFFVGPTLRLTLPVAGLGVDAAALYDQREGKDEEGGLSVKAKSVQIPVNLRYGFGLGSLSEIFLFAGPQFGFNVGDRTIRNEVREWTLRSSNLSGNVGLGATILGHLQAKVNYNFALGKTGEFKGSDLWRNNDAKEGSVKFNSWQLSLAYFF